MHIIVKETKQPGSSLRTLTQATETTFGSEEEANTWLGVDANILEAMGYPNGDRLTDAVLYAVQIPDETPKPIKAGPQVTVYR